MRQMNIKVKDDLRLKVKEKCSKLDLTLQDYFNDLLTKSIDENAVETEQKIDRSQAFEIDKSKIKTLFREAIADSDLSQDQNFNSHYKLKILGLLGVAIDKHNSASI